MNQASYRAGADALDGLSQLLLQREMRKKQDAQQQLENQMRQAMFALQKRGADASIANAEREFGYRKDRDQVGDARYTDQTQYGRGRDSMGDQRYQDATAYSRGRDQVGDQRYQQQVTRQEGRDQAEDLFKNMELGLRMKQATNRGNVGGYVTEDLDEDGNVINTRRRTPIYMNGEGRTAASAGPAARPAASGPTNPAELIQAVRSGKMTKDDAKTYAQKQGWK